MKKVKYVFGVIIIIFIFEGIQIICGPRTYMDIFNRELTSITSGQNTSEFEYFGVQEYNNVKYYLDENSNLCEKREDKIVIRVKNVATFLVWRDKLIFRLHDDEKQVFETPIHGQTKKVIAHVEADIIFSNEKYLYIYSNKSILHKYDSSWREIETVSLKEKGDECNFDKACVMGEEIIFCTEDNAIKEGLDVYIYDEKSAQLQQVLFPENSRMDYSRGVDIARWKGEIYYLLCYYDDGDMHNSLTRTDLSENGIYKLDIKKGKFVKVSNTIGGVLIVVNNQLCVVSDFLFGVLRQINEVEFC